MSVLGLHKYPDLQRRYLADKRRLNGKGCGDCELPKLDAKYKALIQQRSKLDK